MNFRKEGSSVVTPQFCSNLLEKVVLIRIVYRQVIGKPYRDRRTQLLIMVPPLSHRSLCTLRSLLRPVILAVLSGCIVLPSHAVVQTTSATNGSATASVGTDLLQTALDSTTWQSNNNINNGITGTSGENSGTNPAKTVTAGTYDFNLDLTASPFGYDISEVNSYSGWTDARAGQQYSLYFSVVGDSGFTQITPSQVSVAADNESLVTSVFDDTGAFLGEGVDVIRFVVGVNGIANVWREIDVIGTTSISGIETFTSSPSSVSPGDSVTFSWDVGNSYSSVVIDQGVGDVTALTGANGLGSITLDPGPSTSTTYKLTAIFASKTVEAETTTNVTLTPAIYSFTTPSAIIVSGVTTSLAWDVSTNATILTLNGIDVSGTTGLDVTVNMPSIYVLEATNEHGSTSKTIYLHSAGTSDPVISEFLASNDNGYTDENGAASDWIELYNPGSSTISLSGYYLTDDATNLTKWQVPNINLAPDSYLIIFASGANLTNPASELHTNFQLSAGGEYLALTKPDGVSILSDFHPTYPSQETDISYGFVFSDASGGYFSTPTPGEENSVAVTGFVKDTSFSVDRGFHTAPIQVAITTLTAGAQIRYTTDGSPPTAGTGIAYTSPVSISETTVLRAAAFKDGFTPTNIDTHTYIFVSDVIADSSMDTAITQDATYGPQMETALLSVPTVSVTISGDVGYLEQEASIELINFPEGHKQLDAGLERFGGLNTNFAKRSMRINFRKQYGDGKLNFGIFEGQDYSSFQPAGTYDAIELRAGNHDMVNRGAYLSNRYADDATLDMGNIAPHGRFVHVYLNGSYWGQYHLRERWNAAMLSEYFGGGKEDYEAVNGNDRFAADLHVYDGSGDYWTASEAAVAGPQPFTNARDYVDIINEIDFILLYVNGACESEFRAGGSQSQNVPFKFYLKDADGYLRNPGHSVDDDGPLDLMAELASEGDPEYEMLLADRIHKHFFNDGALTPSENIARLQDRKDEAQLSILTESARWGYRSPSSWESYQNSLLNNQFPGQTATMISKFKTAGMYPDIGAPIYSQHGGALGSSGEVTVTVPGNETAVYYMVGTSDTDPSDYAHSLDPRLNGGGVHALANLLTFDGSGGGTAIVQTGDDWKYLDDGSDQGTSWKATSFNDSSWRAGPSQLGYGDGDEAEEVGFIDTDPITDGTQKNATTYFRKSDINIADPSGFENFTLNFVFDDGIAIYVNGAEVERLLLDEDAAYDDFANGTSSENQSGTITLASSLFVAGNNTIAAEVHQRSAGSSDMSFSITLAGNPPSSGSGQVVTLAEPGWLLSRSYNSSTSEWSALNVAHFSLETVPADTTNLVVSKIHYNPADPATGAELAASTDADDFEFLELMNVGMTAIDLSNVTLTGGVTFIFGDHNEIPAGGRLLLVKDVAAFEARYNSIVSSVSYAFDTLGGMEYSGKLGGSGDRLILTDATGSIIRDFTYSDDSPWPTAADGAGFSLVLINPSTPIPDHGVGTNWAASAEVGGSPSEAGEIGFTGEPLADLDGDGFNALLEYALGTSDSESMSSANFDAKLNSSIVLGETEQYLTMTYTQNPHIQNVYEIIPQISTDLLNWESVPNVVLVGQSSNPDGSVTYQYRSATTVSENPEDQEFIRLILNGK